MATDQRQEAGDTVAASEEVWHVAFPHADAPPEGGHRLVRLAQLGAAKDSPAGPVEGNMTIIFLHGGGPGDGVEGWVGLWRSLLARFPAGAEVVLPAGPMIAYTASHSPSPGWFRLGWPSGWQPDRGQFDPYVFSFAGIDDVAAAVRNLAAAEARRRDCQVFLGGFSQGGAVAFWSGVVPPPSGGPAPELAGLFSLSGYLPQPQHVPPTTPPPPPALVMHGDADDVIPLDACNKTADFFERPSFGVGGT